MTRAHNQFTIIRALIVTLLLAIAGSIGAQNIRAQAASPAGNDGAELTAPANDMFSNAQPISGTSNLITGSNTEATVEPGEPQTPAIGLTVWYKWVAPANLSMTFETISGGTMPDTVMGVYTGNNVANLTAIGTNDDINGVQNRFSRVTFIAKAGFTYFVQIRGFNALNGTFRLQYQINVAETGGQFNFDRSSQQVGAGYSDYAVFRPTDTTWYIRLSGGNGSVVSQPWGLATDKLYPGDFDGDGNTDIGVWRPSTGTFYAIRSSDHTLLQVQWGLSFDLPVQGDFDGDDKADFAVWRPTTGTFYVLPSSGAPLMVQQFGQGGDYLACGDYDGDGKTDFGVQRIFNSLTTYYILQSSDQGLIVQPFGTQNDYVVPGDYDGDGKNDIAVYRGVTNTFYAVRSSDGAVFGVPWGTAGDVFTPGDYVGDNRSDITIFRKSTGTFYSLNLTTSALVAQQWGADGDRPIANTNVH
jgi:hypothetical protein